MPKLPPLGTTSGQTAKKPPMNGIVPFSQLYQQAGGGNSLVPPSLPNPNTYNPIVDPRMGAPITTPPDNSHLAVPGDIGSKGTMYVDPAKPNADVPMTLAELAASLGIKLPGGISLEDLPKALPGITLPPAPQRDIKAEGQSRAKQDNLALLLPILSLLGTGNVSAGTKLLPQAYSAINTGAEQFQDKSAQTDLQNYGMNTSRMLQQDQLDSANQKEQTANIQYRNQQKIRQREEDMKTTMDLLNLRLNEKRLDNLMKKTTGDARIKFLTELSKLSAPAQEAYWQVNGQEAADLGLSPTRDVQGQYIPLPRNSDLIGYANAKNGADRNKALLDIASDRIDATYAAIDQRYAAAKTAKEIAQIAASSREKVAGMANEAAWNRLMEGERNVNARFNASDDLKRIGMQMRWHTDMNKPAGQRLSRLFTRNAALRLDRRAANTAIDNLNKSADKFDDATLKKRIAEQQAIVDSTAAELQDTEYRINKLQEEADKGTVNEPFINLMTTVLDRKGLSTGDSGTLRKEGTPPAVKPNYPSGFVAPKPRAPAPARVAPKRAAVPAGTITGKGRKTGVRYTATPE